MTQDDDPAIEAVRAVRRRISERFGHDPWKLVEYYRELQERHRDRLVSRRDQPSKPDGENAT